MRVVGLAMAAVALAALTLVALALVAVALALVLALVAPALLALVALALVALALVAVALVAAGVVLAAALRPAPWGGRPTVRALVAVARTDPLDPSSAPAASVPGTWEVSAGAVFAASSAVEAGGAHARRSGGAAAGPGSRSPAPPRRSPPRSERLSHPPRSTPRRAGLGQIQSRSSAVRERMTTEGPPGRCQRCRSQPWSTGPMPSPSGKPCSIAPVTYSLARPTAPTTSSPSAR